MNILNFILDIILVALLLLFLFIGYKVGFVRVIIKIASIFSGLIAAILLTSTVTNLVFGWGVMNGVATKIADKVAANETFQSYFAEGGGEAGTSAVLEAVGFPKFLANLISRSVDTPAGTAEAAALEIGNGISKVILTVIVFFVLLLGMSLIFWLIKVLFGKLRESIGLLRIIDGILGAALFACIFFIIADIFFTVVAIKIDSTNQFIVWINTQLHLGDEKFGIAKYVYNHNVIKNIFQIFF